MYGESLSLFFFWIGWAHLKQDMYWKSSILINFKWIHLNGNLWLKFSRKWWFNLWSIMTIYWRKQEIIHNFVNLDIFFWLSSWIGVAWKMESVALFRDDHNFKSFAKGKIDRYAVFWFWKPSSSDFTCL
jgi:hypothetical protein